MLEVIIVGLTIISFLAGFIIGTKNAKLHIVGLSHNKPMMTVMVKEFGYEEMKKMIDNAEEEVMENKKELLIIKLAGIE